MKTVKFSLNELMSEIDESFIEEVYFHDCNKILKKYSPNYLTAVCCNVFVIFIVTNWNK